MQINLDDKKALVVFSGGQDSTTCLYWTFDKWGEENTKTLSFDYGQRHSIELESAEKICNLAGVEFDLVKTRNILRSVSPLVDSHVQMDQYNSVNEFEPGVQKTFVPGRNILFLTIAANVAYHHGAKNIVVGVCEEDFGGYYDCRQDFVTSMQKALNQGLFGQDEGLVLHAPLMSLDKRKTVELALDLGSECLEALAFSHTCYEGEFPPCGKCHSCLLRERGFKEAMVLDPLLERCLVK